VPRYAPVSTALYAIMKLRLLAVFLLIVSGISIAEDISAPPPVDLLILQSKKVLEGEPRAGAHGLKEYCYKLDTMYVVYSHNLLGEGYSFFKVKPNQKCIRSKRKKSTTNNLGLTVGISNEQASKLLGITLAEGSNEIVWRNQRAIHNLPYDDMTTLNITIKNGLVYAVSIFNTVTS
jgi:hypothetical protein